MDCKDFTSVALTQLLEMYEEKLVAAICVAPTLVLAHHNLYLDAIMTYHLSFKFHISKEKWRAKLVTCDFNHNLLTSQRPGTALEFAMEIIINPSGKKQAWTVAEPIITLPALHYQKLGSSES